MGSNAPELESPRIPARSLSIHPDKGVSFNAAPHPVIELGASFFDSLAASASGFDADEAAKEPFMRRIPAHSFFTEDRLPTL